MIEAPLGLAFAAGLVATLNPCGFAMLPAFLSYFMGLEESGGTDTDQAGGTALAEALRVGAVVSLGFLAVFGVTGLLINAGVRSIIDWIPYMALIIGLVMVGLGVAMFRGYQLNVGFLKFNAGGTSRDTGSVFSFGVSYALASLSCTLPVFLSVVVGSIAGTNFLSGFLTYVAYGLGMSALLTTVTLAVALAKQRVVKGIRSMLRYVQKVSAGFVIVAGIYITWFWLDNLSSDAGEQGAAARFVEGWSASITTWVQANSGTLGVLAVGSVAITALWIVLKRFEEPTVPPSNDDDNQTPIVDQTHSPAT